MTDAYLSLVQTHATYPKLAAEVFESSNVLLRLLFLVKVIFVIKEYLRTIREIKQRF